MFRLSSIVCAALVLSLAPPARAGGRRSAKSATGPIRVVSASFGTNCGVKPGKATRPVGEACDGRSRCTYLLDRAVLGAAPRDCRKGFIARWRCGDDPQVREVTAWEACEPPHAVPVNLDCPEKRRKGRIQVVSASFGGNCASAPADVSKHLAETCAGKTRCDYTVDHKVIGDPTQRCNKSYVALWRCGSAPTVYRAEVFESCQPPYTATAPLICF
jgi:hypothetical protein